MDPNMNERIERPDMPEHHSSEMSDRVGRPAPGRPGDPEEGRGRAFQRAGLTPGWKRSHWLWTIAALSAVVLVIAAFIVPSQVQAGYVLFSLAFCGLALAGVILLM